MPAAVSVGAGNLVLLLHPCCGLLFSTWLPPDLCVEVLDEKAGGADVLACWPLCGGPVRVCKNPGRHAGEAVPDWEQGADGVGSFHWSWKLTDLVGQRDAQAAPG